MDTIDERSRHDLYRAFEGLVGADNADALMSLLPPVGWADVATKADLDARLGALEERLALRFESMENGFVAKLEAGLRSQMRTLFLGMLTALASMTSLCLAAIVLAR